MLTVLPWCVQNTQNKSCWNNKSIKLLPNSSLCVSAHRHVQLQTWSVCCSPSVDPDMLHLSSGFLDVMLHDSVRFNAVTMSIKLSLNLCFRISPCFYNTSHQSQKFDGETSEREVHLTCFESPPTKHDLPSSHQAPETPHLSFSRARSSKTLHSVSSSGIRLVTQNRTV